MIALVVAIAKCTSIVSLNLAGNLLHDMEFFFAQNYSMHSRMITI